MDLSCGLNGDLELSASGDLRKTASGMEDMIQSIVKRLQTATRDWNMDDPPKCTELVVFGGEGNTRELGWKIEKSITDSLVLDRLLPRSAFTVRVFPTGVDSVRCELLIVSPISLKEHLVVAQIDIVNRHVTVGVM